MASFSVVSLTPPKDASQLSHQTDMLPYGRYSTSQKSVNVRPISLSDNISRRCDKEGNWQEMNITKCHRLTPKEAADKGRKASNTPTKKQVNEKRKIFLHITHISRNNQWNKQSLNGSFELSNFSHILSSFREKIFVSKKKKNSSTCCPLSLHTNIECNPDLTIHTNLKLMARFVDLFILLLLFPS